MGIFDKMKGAINTVTGGGAKVSIEYPNQPMKRGQDIKVKITAISTGGAVKCSGAFIDLLAKEEGTFSPKITCQHCHQSQQHNVKFSHKTFSQSFPVAPAFNLEPNETKEFEGTIQIPASIQPSYRGTISHEWSIQGRIEAFGNDPSSGYQYIEVIS